MMIPAPFWAGDVTAADGCTVVLLTHFDAMPLVNEAPYSITSFGSVYETDTSVKKFGTSSFRAKAATTSRTRQRVTYSPGVETDGSLTIEFWLRRSGGTGALSAGNQWANTTYLEFDTGAWMTFTASNYFHSGSSTYRRGLSIELNDGTDYDEHFAYNIDFLPDSDFHAIAFSLEASGAFNMLADGTSVASGTLSAAFPAGIKLTDLFFAGLLDTERQDEMRVTLGRARYPSNYTPAAGPWVDASCDSATS